MKHKEDLSEFMETIVNRNNISHTTSYDAICKLLFGNKSPTHKVKSNCKQPVKVQEYSNDNKGNRFNNKGKKKFSDINSFQEKKKQKEGN